MFPAPVPLRFNRRPIPGAGAFDHGNPHIYLGTAAGVKKHRKRPGSLLAPIDADPELFKWPVSGESVTLVIDDDQRERGRRLASVLVRDGAELVCCVSEAGLVSIHKKASGLQEFP
jgi:hypothetical protein